MVDLLGVFLSSRKAHQNVVKPLFSPEGRMGFVFQIGIEEQEFSHSTVGFFHANASMSRLIW